MTGNDRFFGFTGHTGHSKTQVGKAGLPHIYGPLAPMSGPILSLTPHRAGPLPFRFLFVYPRGKEKWLWTI